MSFEDFSLPETAISRDDHDLDFKFCSVIEPGESPDSPADHLFSNGRLVPHNFPCSASRTMSWGSSKDGSEFSSSSRNNSLSSSQRSSSSSSSSFNSRTSITDVVSERKVLIRARRPRSNMIKRAPETYKVPEHGSRKWQFIAAAPVLNGNVMHKGDKSTRKNKAESASAEKMSKAKKEGKNNGCWRRFFCLFVSACNEFHAIEPSTMDF